MSNFSKLPPECDDLCRWRWCLQPGEDKGTYVAGRGYTSYHKTPRYVCMSRMLHGCPDGPVVGGERKRPVPNMNKITLDLENVIHEAKATNKVKTEMRKMLHVIYHLIAMIDQSQIYKEPI